LLPDWNELNLSIVLLLTFSSLIGAGFGGWLYLNPRTSRPVELVGKPIREALAYDFGIDRLYKLSVVLGVVQGSRLTAWFDRYVVDGFVNFVGVASIFGGESLKYTISGQSRNYLLTVFFGVFLALTMLGWMYWNWSI
jgi:NAD(P)H-quinone oxidoreductase subunit 5